MRAQVSISGAVFLATLALLTLTHGQIPLRPADTVGAWTGRPASDLAGQIVLEVRPPRVATAIIAGGALGMARALERRDWVVDFALKNLTNSLDFQLGGFRTMLPLPTRHALVSFRYRFGA